MHVDTFLRLDDVKKATGLGRSTIYRLMAETPPRFPKPVNINGGTAIAWLGSEVAAWQQDRIAERDGKAA
ncbi:AlpA family phage regulatory protein [Parvibaculum sp.]|uniref:helix-turn-helix transcriptional regulator n=1 Tax=Parvibaculum sp. TaxID=2024848 RepID=UPI001B1A475E|nr:AlpA family phage regulatory protein [Parvibaculum sp.]MBO6634421.1 AlpA family phage regulatory protein [Parvibaculum sp.]MBO6679170.1 AlpA family phage regulatory protein [Parvibaculum sp.]MBO6685643.1 AlpA family phage regulatory protein [Parvibaculum sp.]